MEKNIIIYQTLDYSIFNIIKENRSTHQGHVAKIMKSLKEKSLMEDIPILVDKSMNIIDGQHRLEACKLLKMPVWYKICDIVQVKHVSIINSINKSWTPVDYLKQYCEMGKSDYIKFDNFMKWAGIETIGIALKFVKNAKTSVVNHTVSGGVMTIFNDGAFKYPDDDTKIKNTIISFKEFNKYCGKSFNRSAVCAYDIISRTEGYSNDRMMQNLAIKPVPPFNDAVTLIDHLDKIYNFNIKQRENILYLNRR